MKNLQCITQKLKSCWESRMLRRGGCPVILYYMPRPGFFSRPEELSFETELQISRKLSSKSPFYLVQSPKFSEMWPNFIKIQLEISWVSSLRGNDILSRREKKSLIFLLTTWTKVRESVKNEQKFSNQWIATWNKDCLNGNKCNLNNQSKV